jgi:hypothetical protein
MEKRKKLKPIPLVTRIISAYKLFERVCEIISIWLRGYLM